MKKTIFLCLICIFCSTILYGLTTDDFEFSISLVGIEKEEDLKEAGWQLFETTPSGKQKTELTIPAEIQGKPVNSIGVFGLYGCDNLVTLNIPATIREIFGQSPNKLKSYSVDKNNPFFCSVDGILYNKLKTELISCPRDKENIPTIPNTVQVIKEYAFSGCEHLEKITIPSSVQEIGESAFSSYNLNEIFVDKKNNNYCSVDGILYNKNVSTLIYCPKQKKAPVIPNTVNKIDNYAFNNYGDVRSFQDNSITIPASVTSIGNSAFSGCKVGSIIIERNVPPAIEEKTFDFFFGTIKVPSGTVNAYKTAPLWGKYADKIVE